MKAIFRSLVLVLSVIAIPGCGGGGGSGSSSGSGGSGGGVTPAPLQLPIQTAKFIDAPVAGVGYNCPAVGTNTTTQTGTTDAQGQFSYQAGQSCTLKVGVITLGTLASIPADGIATPQDIAGVSRTANQAPGAIAIAQFLQSLNDGSVGGAITIPTSVSTALAASTVPATTLVSSTSVADQTTLTAIVAAAGKQLVTPDAAKNALTSGQAASGVDNTRGSVSPTAPVALSSLSASGALTKIGVGASLQLKVTGYYTDGTTKDLTSQASYSSSNVALVTVTSAGLVSAATAGSVVITANASNISSTINLTVVPVYSITASVSGLAGAGLVLQNNGSSDFSLSANGTINIDSAAFSGTAYAVAVKTQPTSPSQTCVVGNGSGTVGGANVTNITVTCTTNTYAITATVSGLSGAGLVLQNNGANDLSFSSNGTFTINSAAPSGSAYAVTVKTQPTSPTQTCLVGGGSGTVGGANVNNMTVSCTTNTYAITATVSGLSGTGLILQNNGANDLSFSTNGTFTINSAALSGSAYAVTVKTQPRLPSQTCVVGGGSGTVGGANVGNITVTCTTNTYAITATVSGLAGTGLVLQNNAANDLSFTSNGTFSINSAVLSGSAYIVTVKTQPTSPIQTCMIGNGSGTVTNAGVNVTVTCTTAPVTVQSSTYSLNVLGIAPSSGSATVTASDPSKLALTYSISQQPSEGSVTIDSVTGGFVYKIDGHPSSPIVLKTSFIVKAANGYAFGLGTVTINLNSDPLLPNQWHIRNTGQNAFSSTLPIAGNDMNVAGAWSKGYSGKGIKVAVVDSGLDATHEDLASNIDLSKSWNFLTSTNNPTSVSGAFDHGTAVAGIIGAVAFNGKGGRGVAYNASLRGYNLLADGNIQYLAQYNKSFGGETISADADVFNASFGRAASSIDSFNSALVQAVNGNVITVRNGLGGALVQSAGNDYNSWQSEAAGSTLCSKAKQYRVSCGDPLTDTKRQGNVNIVVGALAADGKKASYGSTGASLWISAPGGEFGEDSSSISGKSPESYKPAIITTSFTGCANAIVSFKANDLDSKGANQFATQCQYTAMMNGTSSAAPNVSGVIALMLEANPKLSYRDVKKILADTAVKADVSMAPISSTQLLSGSTFTLEQGWVTNAAGYKFNNWYGFGAIDAAAAVAAASAYSNHLPDALTRFYNFIPSANIQIAGQQGKYLSFPITTGMNFVEGVILFATISQTPDIQCNQIEIISPSGTKSVLMHAANGFGNATVSNARMISNAFYGEKADGTWLVNFWNVCPTSSASLVLPASITQQLLIQGH